MVMVVCYSYQDTEVVVAAGISGVLVAAEQAVAVAVAGTQPLVVVVLMAQDMGSHIHCTLCMLFGLFWTLFGFDWNLLLELLVWLRRGCSVSVR